MTVGDLGVDYAWQHPAPATMAAAGYRFAMRYLSNNPPPDAKNIYPAELAALHAAGLGVGLVWETTAGRMLEGAAAGQQDAKRANAQADALGFPAGRPIFFACDTDINASEWAALESYLRAAGSGREAGVYGEFDLIEHMLGNGVCRWGWQTVAWSGGKLSDKAHLYQRGKPTRPSIGTDYDEDVALKDDYGVWFSGSTPPPPQPKEWDQVATKEEVQAVVVQAIKDEFEWYAGPIVVLSSHGQGYLIPTLGGIVRAMADKDTAFSYAWSYQDGTLSADTPATAGRKPLDLAVPAPDPTHGPVYGVRVLHGAKDATPIALAQYTHMVTE